MGSKYVHNLQVRKLNMTLKTLLYKYLEKLHIKEIYHFTKKFNFTIS